MIYIICPCSGCHESEISQENYKWDAKNNIRLGSGCRECGYTGKRKRRIPLTNHSTRIANDPERKINIEL